MGTKAENFRIHQALLNASVIGFLILAIMPWNFHLDVASRSWASHESVMRLAALLTGLALASLIVNKVEQRRLRTLVCIAVPFLWLTASGFILFSGLNAKIEGAIALVSALCALTGGLLFQIRDRATIDVGPSPVFEDIELEEVEW